MTENVAAEIPVGWVWSDIGVVVQSRVDQAGPDGPTEFLYIDISSIDTSSKKISEPKTVPVSAAPSRARQRIKPQDVLVSMTRPNLNAVAIVPEGVENAVGSTGFDVLRAIQIDPRWLFYFVQTTAFVESMSMLVQGALYPAIRPKDIRGHRLPVAPIQEQRRIISEIEKQLTRLDAAVVALKRVQANLKRYRAAVLKAACEGRLVPTEAELARQEGRSYEPASVLLKRMRVERRARVQNPQESKSKELPTPATDALPTLREGWVWITLSELIESGPQNGIYLPKSKYGKGSPILRIDDFQIETSRSSSELRVVDSSEEETATYSLLPGDIVVNRVNSPSHLGKTLLVEDRNVPALFESNMMRMRLDEKISSQFIVFYLSSIVGRARLISNAKWAVNQASINQQDVLMTPVPLPPAAEQVRIVSEVSHQISILKKIQAQIDASVKRSEKLRQSILKDAFEGKLVEQDANDEPASVLLERIPRAAAPAPTLVDEKSKKKSLRKKK